VKRVVLIGSESTGKTTLAQRLAAHYDVDWVPEFVRDYAAEKEGTLDFADHAPIARGQSAREDEFRSRATARNEHLLIGDTDLLSTAVYCAHYYGQCPRWIRDAARARRPDLYLLLDVDLPWTPDPQRDRGHMRLEMHALFRDAVERSGVPYVLVSGDTERRFATARAAIDNLLNTPGVTPPRSAGSPSERAP
jgi:NadR type nicotinamide-nucleotide adenylyltransferase